MSKILQRAEFCMDRGVSALFRANRPGTARISLLRGRRVIFTFAKALSDGMDGRQVQHVKSQARNVVESRFTVFEGPVPTWLRRRRARKHLIPRGVLCLLAVHRHAQFALVARLHRRIEVLRHHGRKLWIQRRDLRRVNIVRGSQLRGPAAQIVVIVLAGTFGSLLNQQRSVQQVDANVLAGGNAFFQIAAPGVEMVDPAGDGVNVFAHARNRKLRTPTIVGEGLHRHGRPLVDFIESIQQARRNVIVAIGKYVCLNCDGFPDDALDGVTPPSISGSTLSMTVRFRPSAGFCMAPIGSPAAVGRALSD